MILYCNDMMICFIRLPSDVGVKYLERIKELVEILLKMILHSKQNYLGVIINYFLLVSIYLRCIMYLKENCFAFVRPTRM